MRLLRVSIKSSMMANVLPTKRYLESTRNIALLLIVSFMKRVGEGMER